MRCPLSDINSMNSRVAFGTADEVSTIRVGVVAVNYHKGTRLVQVLGALRHQTLATGLKVIIVDNSCAANEEELLRGAVQPSEQLIINSENAGYTRACNVGARAVLPSDYVLLLNPDIIIDDPGAIETLATCMATNPTIGVLGCLQRNDDGSYVETARHYPSLWRQILRRLRPGACSEMRLLEPLLRDPAIDIVDVDWLQSSFILIRRDLWEAIGGLDETYYVFMADVDFCRRARASGYRVSVTSLATVRADGIRASSGGLIDVFRSRALRIHIADAVRYYWRSW
ncbi:MAG: glycosyltransferase [Rhodobacteraceae bacterium]|nr:glycosyltransferase [Paracoccaceae bacterium]